MKQQILERARSTSCRSPSRHSGGSRGCLQGASVIVVPPDVLEVFPDVAAVNETLRALVPVLRRCRATEQ